MKKKKTIRLSDQLRKAVDESGVTRYRLSQNLGIDQGALSRFHHGKSGLSWDAVDRIGEYLGLKIIREEK